MRLVDHSLDGRALGTQRGAVAVVVERGAPCASCAEPIGRREAALFRWDRAARALGRDEIAPRGVVEIVHAACVARRPP